MDSQRSSSSRATTGHPRTFVTDVNGSHPTAVESRRSDSQPCQSYVVVWPHQTKDRLRSRHSARNPDMDVCRRSLSEASSLRHQDGHLHPLDFTNNTGSGDEDTPYEERHNCRAVLRYRKLRTLTRKYPLMGKYIKDVTIVFSSHKQWERTGCEFAWNELSGVVSILNEFKSVTRLTATELRIQDGRGSLERKNPLVLLMSVKTLASVQLNWHSLESINLPSFYSSLFRSSFFSSFGVHHQYRYLKISNIGQPITYPQHKVWLQCFYLNIQPDDDAGAFVPLFSSPCSPFDMSGLLLLSVKLYLQNILSLTSVLPFCSNTLHVLTLDIIGGSLSFLKEGMFHYSILLSCID